MTRLLEIRSRTETLRKFAALLVIFAFALQSFFTQTHIHGLPQHLDGLALIKIDASDPAGSKVPGDTSPLDCPYCQAVTHSGLFFVPTNPLLRLPVSTGEQIVQPIALQVVKSAAMLSRRSRSPPL